MDVHSHLAQKLAASEKRLLNRMEGLFGLLAVLLGLVFVSNYFRIRELFEDEKKEKKACPECGSCTTWIVISVLFILYIIYKLFRYFTKDSVPVATPVPIA